MNYTKFFFPIGGGYGDLVTKLYKFDVEPEFQKLSYLKKHYPEIKTLVMIASHNRNAVDLMKYDPAIDHIYSFQYQFDNWGYFNRYKGDYKRLHEFPEIDRLARVEKFKVYVDPQEQQVIDSLKAIGKPIVLINPFAGTFERIGIPQTELYGLVDRFIDECGCHVVVIGSSHIRSGTNEQYTPNGNEVLDIPPDCIKVDGKITYFNLPEEKINVMPISESWNYERNGLTNLVNKHSIRLSTQLTTLCSGFIGNFTGPTLMAWICEKPTVCFIIKGNPENVDSKNQSIAWPIVKKLPLAK